MRRDERVANVSRLRRILGNLDEPKDKVGRVDKVGHLEAMEKRLERQGQCEKDRERKRVREDGANPIEPK